MHDLNAIYVRKMVEAVRSDKNREAARQEDLIETPKTSFVATLRRMIGEFIINAGTFIQGPPKPESAVEPCTICQRSPWLPE